MKQQYEDYRAKLLKGKKLFFKKKKKSVAETAKTISGMAS